jgi:heme exporter protein A
MPLVLDRVAKFYGNKLIFKELSFRVEPGAILLVLGPNGAGKSTLLKLLAGLDAPSSGRIERSIGQEKIGYLGHQTFIYPGLSGIENLAFWTKLYGLACTQEELYAALARVELKRAALERAGCYSRGMAQRLSLARVFLLAPELLLLDEPATGLDQRSAAILEREILAAKTRGASVVWVSHEAERDRRLADAALVIEAGRQRYFGPAADYAQLGAQQGARENA